MTLEEFKKLFALAPERYPQKLESRFPRILNSILANWDSPHEQEAFLRDLVVDTRGNRQGFPPGVMEEILFISELYHRWRLDRRRTADPKRMAELSPKLVPELEAGQKPLNPELIKKLDQLKVLISKDNPAAISFLAENGIQPNQKDRDGQTPLMHAAQAGAENVLLNLIKMNANPHVQDITGNTPLHWAVVMNRLRMVEIMLYFGSNPNAKNKAGATPFSLSVIKSDPSIAKRLLDYEADILLADNMGNFPLHKAVSAKSKENIWLLLSVGASKENRNKEGLSPEDIASRDPDISALFEKFRSQALKQSLAEKSKR